MFEHFQSCFTPLFPVLSDEEVTEWEQRLDEFTNEYFSLITEIHERVREKKNAQQVLVPPFNGSSSSATARTPKIELPTFDGSSDKWIKFRDIFESLIHTKTNISNIEKFSYLHSSIKLPEGHANVLDNFKICENDYAAAWKAVCDRYDDKRKIIAMHCATLFEVQKMSCESASELRRIIDSFSSQISALKQLGYVLSDHADFANMIVVQFALVRLDENTLREWKKFHISDSSTWKELHDFLTAQWRSIDDDAMQCLKTSKEAMKQKPMKALVANNDGRNQSRLSSAKCPVCCESHYLFSCQKFNAMSIDERQKVVREKRLCLNCFNSAHQVRQCPSKFRCKTCHQPHHTLLHFDKSIGMSSNFNVNKPHSATMSADSVPFTPYNMNKKSNDGASSSKTSSVAALSSEVFCARKRSTFLSTVLLEVADAEGSFHTVRALLDNGSDDNFMTTSLVRRIRLKCEDVCVPLTGIGEKTSTVLHQTSTTIRSLYGPYQKEIECSVIASITGNVPSQNASKSKFHIPVSHQLADPDFNLSAKVEMLLDIDVFYDALLSEKITLLDGPKMVHTKFGWIIGGSTQSVSLASPRTLLSCFAASYVKGEEKINQSLDRYFSAEEVDVPTRVLTPEEVYCEENYKKTMTRGTDGRFILRMPLKANITQLGRNFKNSLQMLYAQEGVRKKNEVVNHLYVEYMNDYETSKNMEEVVPDNSEFAHYLPHHGVVKMASTSTKLRPVCNASSKSETGLSLNDALCVGPMVQPESFDILLRSREKLFVLMGDLTKMYRQMWIHPEQRKYLRILWRVNPETDPIKHFQMNTVTFGTASATFLATRSILQLALENEEKFPKAAAVIKNSMFVDDLLVSFHTIEEGKLVLDQLRFIFAGAGLKLCKISSNVADLLEGIPTADVEASPDDEENNITKTLGIGCELERDQFTYNLKTPAPGPLTKAKVLSEIASVYDPLGWIGPVVLQGKLFMKKLWSSNIGWKDLLSEELREQWIEHRESLPLLREIKIKRHCIIPNPVNVEMHGFSDASIEAYGACVYIRSTDADGKVQVSLICGKSKVAPMKQQTLARLELCGALLLAKLVQRLIGILETPIEEVTFWCDSTIVLNWITMTSSKLQTFVGNRVAAIQQITAAIQKIIKVLRWMHITGIENPADKNSRGLAPKEIIVCDLWWNGPTFLQLPKSQWPESIVIVSEDDPEVKKEVKKSLVVNREPSLFEFIELRFSNTRTLINVIAYIQRFTRNAKQEDNRRFGPLSIEERDFAEVTVIKTIQKVLFSVEYDVLMKQNELRKKIESGELATNVEIPQVPRKSSIISLTPFLDETGLMRVGGRVQASDQLTENQKHQIILPRCHFTARIVREIHYQHLHPGPKAMLSFVRERFWPIKAASTIRKVAHDCLTCYRIKPIDTQQLMAPLPPARVTMAPPFTSTALDYAGFYTIRTGIMKKSSTTKCYIAVFKCMCTGAIHLDVVSDLSAKAFITTFDRFVSRRGLCKELYTDNGTCFEGADNELRATLDKIDAEIQEHVREQRIRWKFTTPRASHAGGIYESAVKSMKHHLKRVMVEQKHIFTFEQFYSVLCKIEGILNSRPLTPMSESVDDLQVLTPGHFLVGRPLISKPERNYLNTNTNRLNVFEKLQQVQQQFWHTWYHEYLHTLQQRPVKFREESKFEIGDMVLVKDSNLPPLRWMMGRIVKLFPGKDKVVRNVRVKTATGEKERHVKYLCLLPLDKESL